ncbi:MAG: SusC/RagA family TonB-linked outer membrane protein [Bacteroidales bacterium]|nr:SusC/RagA family TonB-linked outer membrane protein [Bacteroidales bacterium]
MAMLVSSLAFGQNLTVTGVVKDSSTGEGVPFASLQIKGTMTGTSSDMDGYYTISVPADGVLIFSSVGYVTLEVPVAGKAQHDIMLSPDTEAIEETIVVAFGTATKESFTGSATVIKSDDIAKIQTSDATRALEGMVAGVQMTTVSGSLGSKPSIQIRGVGSINAGTSPLYVIDGIPYGSDFDMNNLNPSDIESMTVLKDAASNALYGARGANGVIMITTKKAKHGDAVVSVDAKWGLNTKALRNYDYITEPGQYYEMYYSALKMANIKGGMSEYNAHIAANQTMLGDVNNGGLGYLVYSYPEGQAFIGMNGKLNPNATLGRYVDYGEEGRWLQPDNWLDAAYRNSMRQEYNLSVSGSTGKASILASFGYLDDQAIINNSDMTRFTARLRADYQAKDWLKIGANVGFTDMRMSNGNSSEGVSGATTNIFEVANQIAPIYPLFVRDGMGRIMVDKYGYQVYDYGKGENGGATRPYLGNSNAVQGSLLDSNTSMSNAFNGTSFAEIKFLKDFTFTFNAGFGIDETRSTSIMNKFYGQYANMGGLISKGHSKSYSINLQQLLSWSRTFAGVHNVSVLLGHENYSSYGYSLSASKSQMFDPENDELNGAVVDGQSAGSASSEYKNEGFFLRAQYDFANRIFVSGSFRRDGSSRFHPDHRWGNFWSLGGGWILDQESWFPKVRWVDMLKFKASVGSQGNDSIGSDRFVNVSSLMNQNGTPSLSLGSVGNKEITWETRMNFNTGFDFELLKRRITGSIEYFYNTTTNMLMWFTTPVSASNGISNGYWDNVGNMRNAGIEFSTNIGVVRKQDLSWDVYFNFTHYTNKITSLHPDNIGDNLEGYPGYASGNRYVGVGLPFKTFYLRQYAGVDRETGAAMWYKNVKDANGNVIDKVTTTEYNDADYYLCGDPTPELYGGFGTSFSYKGFDFAASFTYSIGGLAYDSGYATYMTSPSAGKEGGNFHKDMLKAWTPENKDTDVPAFYYNELYASSTSDRFLTDASYLNFQNAQIGYTLPARIAQKARVSRIRFYAACDNIVYWSARRGLDPRQSHDGSTSNVMNSPVRTTSVGFNITF